MEQNTTEMILVLHEDELNSVTGGIAVTQIWVSPLAIRGFNPQPDPPAFQDLRVLGPAAHA